mmetsp:Transcript_21542/g.67573  ORF Transcript_21542/g.67573 Transcript_21542/m.67573 type:complete len:569 (+) Transcript_21542:757-2463(+)
MWKRRGSGSSQVLGERSAARAAPGERAGAAAVGERAGAVAEVEHDELGAGAEVCVTAGAVVAGAVARVFEEVEEMLGLGAREVGVGGAGRLGAEVVDVDLVQLAVVGERPGERLDHEVDRIGLVLFVGGRLLGFCGVGLGRGLSAVAVVVVVLCRRRPRGAFGRQEHEVVVVDGREVGVGLGVVVIGGGVGGDGVVLDGGGGREGPRGGGGGGGRGDGGEGDLVRGRGDVDRWELLLVALGALVAHEGPPGVEEARDGVLLAAEGAAVLGAFREALDADDGGVVVRRGVGRGLGRGGGRGAALVCRRGLDELGLGRLWLGQPDAARCRRRRRRGRVAERGRADRGHERGDGLRGLGALRRLAGALPVGPPPLLVLALLVARDDGLARLGALPRLLRRLGLDALLSPGVRHLVRVVRDHPRPQERRRRGDLVRGLLLVPAAVPGDHDHVLQHLDRLVQPQLERRRGGVLRRATLATLPAGRRRLLAHQPGLPNAALIERPRRRQHPPRLSADRVLDAARRRLTTGSPAPDSLAPRREPNDDPPAGPVVVSARITGESKGQEKNHQTDVS